MPINAINFALASALLLMPPHYSVEHYQAQQKVELKLASDADFKAIAERILAANGTIEMFYRLAYADITFFEHFPEGDLAQRFAQTSQLIQETQAYKGQFTALDENLALFSKNFQKLNRLYESYEYKKEADKVLLSRVNSPTTVTIQPNTSREEIERLIFG